MQAKLVVINGDATKSEVKLNKFPTTVGRTTEAGLTINHPMVSRIHCTLYEVQGVLVVRDNNSSNGTLINKHKITEAVLHPGDQLTIGPLTFVAVYRQSGPDPSVGDDRFTESEANLQAFTEAAQKLDYDDPTAIQHGESQSEADLNALAAIAQGLSYEEPPEDGSGENALETSEDAGFGDFGEETPSFEGGHSEEPHQASERTMEVPPDMGTFFKGLLDLSSEESIAEINAGGFSQDPDQANHPDRPHEDSSPQTSDQTDPEDGQDDLNPEKTS